MGLIFSRLDWPWAIIAVAWVVLLLMVAWSRRPRRVPSDTLLVAGSDLLRTLPRYQTLLRRRRRTGALLVIGSLLVVAGAALVVSRPQVVSAEARDSRARDIIVCLDASPSMDDDNALLVHELRRIVDGLHGDKVGMMIWSSAAVLVFPLTDDYDYVRAQLSRAERAFEGQGGDFYAGVELPDAGASLIGDGIVSCARRFDKPSAARTRVLMVTSDNQPVGRPTYSLSQAAQYAADNRVLVYAIGAPSLDDPQRAAARRGFASVATRTGGVFTVVGQDDGADLISDRLEDLTRARSTDLPRLTAVDRPLGGAAVSLLGLGLLSGIWWSQRKRSA